MNLLDVPAELRSTIFGLVLALPQPVYIYQELGLTGVEAFITKKPLRWLALLATSKAVHDEAAAVLFGANHFHMMDAADSQSSVLLHFLDTIGSKNAARLNHVRMSFPPAVTVAGGRHAVDISNQGKTAIGLLRARCTSLVTLEVLLQRATFNEIVPLTPALIHEALLLAQVEFASICWLDKIIAKLHWAVSRETAEFMEALGWVVVRNP